MNFYAIIIKGRGLPIPQSQLKGNEWIRGEGSDENVRDCKLKCFGPLHDKKGGGYPPSPYISARAFQSAFVFPLVKCLLTKYGVDHTWPRASSPLI